MTFIKYYIEQFKDVPLIWKIAKKNNDMWRFWLTVSLLFFPMAIFMMYLYDTGRIEVDKRYAEKYVKDCRQADKDFVENRIKENKNE